MGKLQAQCFGGVLEVYRQRYIFLKLLTFWKIEKQIPKCPLTFQGIPFKLIARNPIENDMILWKVELLGMGNVEFLRIGDF